MPVVCLTSSLIWAEGASARISQSEAQTKGNFNVDADGLLASQSLKWNNCWMWGSKILAFLCKGAWPWMQCFTSLRSFFFFGIHNIWKTPLSPGVGMRVKASEFIAVVMPHKCSWVWVGRNTPSSFVQAQPGNFRSSMKLRWLLHHRIWMSPPFKPSRAFW